LLGYISEEDFVFLGAGPTTGTGIMEGSGVKSETRRIGLDTRQNIIIENKKINIGR
jgi:hypothetical protein